MRIYFWIEILLLSMALCQLTACNRERQYCISCEDDGMNMPLPSEPNTASRPTNTPFAPSNPTNNDLANDSADATISELPALRLTCEHEPLRHMMLYGTISAQPMPLTQWERTAEACNAYTLTRPSGHRYRLTMIQASSIHSIDEWLSTAKFGNSSPPTEIIEPHRASHAYVYTRTDLGMPKIYALYFHSWFVMYIEWEYTDEGDPEVRLRALNDDHLTLDIPDDLRALLADMN